VIRLGITGTDTGVGKTLIATALIAVARSRGLRVAAMKPVETGVEPGHETDAERLIAAAGGVPTDVCSYHFAEPLAPMVAADRAGTPVDIDVLDAALERLGHEKDVVVVEGAGGLLVPITPRVTYADLFRRWRLDLVIVAANRLGALNHVSLTVRAAQRAGLRPLGIVLNESSDVGADLAQQTNAAALRELLPDVPLFRWPWVRNTRDRELADVAERSGLASVLREAATPTLIAHLDREI